MVGYEKTSKAVLHLGPPEPAFIARGERNFDRFAAVLNQHLKGRTWLTGNDLTIADFSVGAMASAAERLELPVTKFPEIARWYKRLAALPAWQASVVRR
jgi:glutathione S-transferase